MHGLSPLEELSVSYKRVWYLVGTCYYFIWAVLLSLEGRFGGGEKKVWLSWNKLCSTVNLAVIGGILIVWKKTWRSWRVSHLTIRGLKSSLGWQCFINVSKSFRVGVGSQRKNTGCWRLCGFSLYFFRGNTLSQLCSVFSEWVSLCWLLEHVFHFISINK